MKPRSSGTTPEQPRRPVYTASRPPRSDAAAERHHVKTVSVVKGLNGFGFTLGDTEYGQYRSLLSVFRCDDGLLLVRIYRVGRTSKLLYCGL